MKVAKLDQDRRPRAVAQGNRRIVLRVAGFALELLASLDPLAPLPPIKLSKLLVGVDVGLDEGILKLSSLHLTLESIHGAIADTRRRRNLVATHSLPQQLSDPLGLIGGNL